MPSATWTILNLIRWTEERFKKEGLSTPRLDAEVLLAEALELDRVGLYTHFDQPLQPEELTRFKRFIQRRLRHEPIAYIIGKQEFWSLDFKVTLDVLIPRPETELLVCEALKSLTQQVQAGKNFRVLEIGTGSGAITVALAKEFPSASYVATDLSEKAIRIAKENASQNGVLGQILFLQGDLYNPLDPDWRFDLILTNPPYISQDLFPSLPPEVRDFEPRLALNGGIDGLEFFRRVLLEMGSFLNPGGWFLSEIGAGQDREIQPMAETNPAFDRIEFIPDLSGIKRVFKIHKK